MVAMHRIRGQHPKIRWLNPSLHGWRTEDGHRPDTSCFISHAEAVPAHQNLGEKEGVSENVEMTDFKS